MPLHLTKRELALLERKLGISAKAVTPKPRKRPERAEYLSLKAFPVGRTVVLRESDAGRMYDYGQDIQSRND